LPQHQSEVADNLWQLRLDLSNPIAAGRRANRVAHPNENPELLFKLSQMN
jgi:hypothetical protein